MNCYLMLVVRYLSVVGLIASGIWIGADLSNVEPYVAAIAAFAAFIASDVVLINRLSIREPDRQLFKQFLSDLPPEGSMKNVREHDMAATFHQGAFEQLFRFHAEWNTPDREFLDARLEKKRKGLFDYAAKFHQVVALKTFVLDKAGSTYGIPRELRDREPEDFDRVASELNLLGNEVTRRYDDLVRSGRRVLGV